MVRLRNQLDELVSDDVSQVEYDYELVISAFTNSIARLMSEQGVSQAELARRLGVSRARVSQLMQHRSSPTLHTMVRVAHAIGCDIHVVVVANSAATAVDSTVASSTGRTVAPIY